ncbi:uncharacterized protein RCC_11454 [Ramularia collo-cygni]|uniref:Uncharacterized protein n=1 Tax=Ramularia collo-cygni TaxID=112498 RepID=A0A2D3VEW7_9PEZI|nr:uncharacterized protein RCC_11454 [Ramularia collo-cygni]CZT25785.1 uncharacterized protein RCC_11454 [Ramularia collo-cygni]
MAGEDKPKVAINGTTSIYNPTTQDEITMALLQNGGVRRIQNTFQQRLDEAGWSQNLREYVERLFRSGEAQTYDDALKIVMQHISLQSQGQESKANGNGGVPDLTIPRDAAKDAAATVKKELAQVVKMDK